MSHLQRRFPLLLLLFAASGCSALIYEIVWYHLLQLEIGSTAISIGVLLATFMGGLSIGSIGLPKLRVAIHPLRLYAMLEAGIAACGLLVLVLLPLVGRAYLAVAAHGIENMLLRGLLAAVCMLPPTILMGASLPAISRWLENTPEGTARLGWLYGANTAGAVLGCLAAGFYLLRLYNVYTASFVAAAINLAVAAVSLWIARETPLAEPAAGDAPRPAAGPRPIAVYLAIALSGAGALGAEVVWTRLMGMLLGSTVYVFSIILAVFLIGLAAGSAGGASLARSLADPRRARLALGWCQVFAAAGVAWTALMITDSLPYWPIDPMLSPSNWFIFQLDMARCLWAILPPTILWGASFPLALAAAARPGEDSAQVVGGIYAANTLGAIAGALAVSLALVPWIGSQNTQRLLLVLSAAGAWVLLVPRWRERQAATALAASFLLAAVATPRIRPIPPEVIAFGRRIATNAGKAQILHVAEGRNSSVVISRWEDGATQIDVNGHVEATNEPFDMKLQRMVGHLAALTHPNPRKVLGIGFGAGVSAGTFTRYSGIQSITVCEIEPVIPPISTRFFSREDYSVLHDPRTRIVYDDARHYLLTTPEKYDIIASDPLDVFVKGTAALYSKEYFESVKAHLNPGGSFTLYVPLYESDVRTVKSELATFFEAFPNATVWANTLDGQGYDMVFMGSLAPPRIDVDEAESRLRKVEFAPVLESLHDIGVNSAVDLFATYMGSNADFAAWVKGADINRDRDLRLQYLGGWGINSSLADPIYREMLASRRLASHPFTGSPERVQALLNYAGGLGMR